ncbi:spore cortex biosynthesis protein YabQ [Oceanirhabdus sp. W0125-5]|uniref:spore cortex biosynthesis protein YabQ n=1 Tax=Oceanirhabdus sp. W0125-5 TaxID=2999116 RepID=UPI0022F2D929|nr:spore cortex biosynthesis protein YabQ [Oceanirhabdus sp. W0125-5]WBW97938.1 spore cortex biosynthesis protein YabQ [Oceanirhabdus sp. W0125-5]
MILSIWYQIIILIGSLLAGVIIGLFFEFYKTIIKDFRRKKITLFFLDIIFWCISGMIIYFWLFVICNAIMATYVILFILIGIGIYYFILAPILEGVFDFIYYKIFIYLRGIIRVLIYPLELLCKMIFVKRKNIKK